MSQNEIVVPQFAGLRTSSLNLSHSSQKACDKAKLKASFHALIKRTKDKHTVRILEKLRRKLLTETITADDAVLALLDINWIADETKARRSHATNSDAPNRG